MNKLILIAVGFFMFQLAGLLAQPVFNISDGTANNGETVEIDFTVENFEKIISIQFSVNWDSTVLEYDQTINASPDLVGIQFISAGGSSVKKGQLTLNWLEQNTNPINLADGTLIFTLVFNVVGDPCDQTTINITDTPLEIEVAEEGEIPVSIVINEGNFNIPGPDCPAMGAFSIDGSTEAGDNGDNVCVTFSATGFRDLAAAQFSLEFDENVIAYTNLQNFGLPALGTGNFNAANAENGEIVFFWADATGMGVDIPDGTIIFEVCFDIIGSTGQFSNINYIDLPESDIEIADNNGTILEVDLNPGRVNVTGGGVEGFALFFEEECGGVNSTLCVDLTGQDFEDILSMEGIISWDPQILSFDRFDNFGIPDFSAANTAGPSAPGNGPGKASLSWLDLTLAGVDVPDDDVLFSICFQLIGNNGQTSSVTFLSLEIADSGENILNPTIISGSVSIQNDCSPCGFSIDNVNNPCGGDTNGSIELSVFGCPGPITYSWTGPNNFTSNAEDVSNLVAGDYMVTITTGDNQILVPGTITLAMVDELSCTAVLTQPTGGMNNGAIDLTVMGGTAPYTYVWAPGGGNSEDLVEIGEGQYTVTITDDSECTFVCGPFVLGAGLALNVTDVMCFGGATGAIDLTVAFGTGPHTFLWNDPAMSITEDISGLLAGEYCVTVTDANATTMSICANVLTPSSAITVNSTITNDDGNTNGSIVLSVTGGQMPYSFLWDFNDQTTQNLIGLNGGMYCVTVTDNLNCEYTECFTVFGKDLEVSLAAMDFNGFGVSCPGECDGEIIPSVGNGIGTIIYAWGDGSTDAMRTDLCAGVYTVVVTDDSGLTATASIELTSADEITITGMTTTPSAPGALDGNVSITVNGGVAPYSYLWNDPVQSTTQNISNLESGSYMVIVTDANNCQATNIFNLLGDTECYEGRSVITPNGDNRNEDLVIACANTLNNKITIFNRWGSIVYEQANYNNTWQGVDQDDDPLPDGGYHWVLEVFLNNGDTRLYRGTVSVVRSLK